MARLFRFSFVVSRGRGGCLGRKGGRGRRVCVVVGRVCVVVGLCVCVVVGRVCIGCVCRISGGLRLVVLIRVRGLRVVRVEGGVDSRVVLVIGSMQVMTEAWAKDWLRARASMCAVRGAGIRVTVGSDAVDSHRLRSFIVPLMSANSA